MSNRHKNSNFYVITAFSLAFVSILSYFSTYLISAHYSMCNTHNFKFLWDTIHWQTIYMVLSKKKMRKNHPMVPPLDHFQGKNKNCSSFTRTISASRRSFFANLATFERRSGLKNFSLLKIAILKMGWLSKFQSQRSWGDAHLSLAAAQAPPN